jgi:hypothetical protein
VTTWNAADKQPDIVLSGGGLTATYAPTSGGSGGKVRGTDAGGTGKYFEVTINARALASGSAFSLAAGVANLSSPLTLSNDPTNSAMYFVDGWFLAPGTSANSGTSLAPGDIIGVHYKTGGSIEISKANTPRSTIVTWPTPPSGALYPCLWLQANNDAATANFGATAFAFLPAGASAWNVAGGSLTPISASAVQTMDSFGQLAYANTGGTTTPPVFGTGGYFPDTIAAILAGRTVRCDFLVFLDFATTPMRVWIGHGRLHTNDGNDWQGLGQLARIGDLESSIGGTSPQATFSLSGVDPNILAAALNAQDEINNRNVDVLIQFFGDNLQPLDNPYVVWAGIMDTVRIRQSGSDSCTVEMSAETIFARRALAPLGNLTDREQQQFFPGDTGLAGIPSLMSKVAIWPVILPGYP